MPAQHRRTYGAIYEVMLALSFTLLPVAGGLLAHTADGYRYVGLPGGVTLAVAPRPHRGRGQDGQPANSALRQQGTALDCGGTRHAHRYGEGAAAAVPRAVRPRPAALDDRRHLVRAVRRELLLLLSDPVAQGPGRSG